MIFNISWFKKDPTNFTQLYLNALHQKYIMDTIATVDPLINPNKPPAEIEISKALTVFGFGSWTGLEPSKYCKSEK